MKFLYARVFNINKENIYDFGLKGNSSMELNEK
jgi:hypothetical protein